MSEETKTKPGYKTTEFWLTFAAMVVGTLLMSGALADDSVASKVVGAIATVLTALGYQVTRAKAKALPEAK